jgi:flagellar basal body rod protein FlgG
VGNFQLREEDDVNELFLKDDGNVAIGIGLRERELGRIKVVKIEDLTKLERLSSSYYKLPDKFQELAVDMEDGEFSLSGRTLENANITPVKEMITMIDSMRKYEMAQRLMKMRDGLKMKEYQTFGS